MTRAAAAKMTKDVLNFQKEPLESGLRLVTEKSDAPDFAAVEKQFVNFMFLRITPDWRKLATETKEAYKHEFQNVFDSFRDEFLLYSYSLIGFDSKADLMFWRVVVNNPGPPIHSSGPADSTPATSGRRRLRSWGS